MHEKFNTMFGFKALSPLVAIALLAQSIRSASATTLVVIGITVTESDEGYVEAACVWDNNQLVIEQSTTNSRAGWMIFTQGNWQVSTWYDSMCDASKGNPFYMELKAPNVGSWSDDIILDSCMNNNDHTTYRCRNRYGRYILYNDDGMSGDDIRRHTAECIDWFKSQCVGEPTARNCIDEGVPNCWAN
ncbi:hypothetical protein BGZ83_007679 [Gryganskiella cystojenkinii]|nr:hypothetical protein BGZ83_007679 [Gryganskiella cystojenkinii]